MRSTLSIDKASGLTLTTAVHVHMNDITATTMSRFKISPNLPSMSVKKQNSVTPLAVN